MDTTKYVGHWVSANREPLQNQDGSTIYLVRDFTLSENDWKLILSAYGDMSSEESKLFTATVEGAYRVTEASASVPGAEEAEFDFNKITFTPHADMFVQILNQAKSGNGNWQKDDAQDVSSTGALFFGPTSQYSREYDLLKVDGSNLYFGKRPADNNMGSPEKRPTELTSAPVVKQ